MIEKTHAVVLRYTPFSNSSRIVYWLTESHGRVSTMIKGSQRPKSLFLGQYDLFYTCELLFYAKRREQLKIVKEVSPIADRPRLRTDWKAAAAASYLSSLMYRVTPPDSPHPGLYRFLDAALDHLQEHGVQDAFLFWYELKLLKLLGQEPRLNRCVECGKAHDISQPRAGFSFARGGILCARCARLDGSNPESIPPDIFATFSAWQKSDSPAVMRRTRYTVRQLESMKHLLGAFLSYHLEMPLRSRSIALDTLARKVA